MKSNEHTWSLYTSSWLEMHKISSALLVFRILLIYTYWESVQYFFFSPENSLVKFRLVFMPYPPFFFFRKLIHYSTNTLHFSLQIFFQILPLPRSTSFTLKLKAYNLRSQFFFSNNYLFLFFTCVTESSITKWLIIIPLLA